MSSPAKKSRIGISEIQRKAIRTWYNSQEPRPSHIACINWFEQTYNRRLNQCTVSLILSKKYEYLDHGPASTSNRMQRSQWPLLEKPLSKWLQQQEELGVTASMEEIYAKAREIWPTISEYQDRQPPLFSAGWLQKFKQRHAHRVSTGHDGILPAAPQNARMEITGLRTICGEYPHEDVYSMDETGLLWRRVPFDALTLDDTHPILNKDKVRVCLVVCTKSAGSDRVPLWVIGHKETPKSLRGRT